ncbi:hypothetical protein BKA62DRAFT_832090 [Auriculariales sp. MPI-PUGE-AT-0066]|nr:hypothetical protein BKA62DRAFT_832090 [Auriculariales sp. MPI-PUGE-AT-0066]
MEIGQERALVAPQRRSVFETHDYTRDHGLRNAPLSTKSTLAVFQSHRSSESRANSVDFDSSRAHCHTAATLLPQTTDVQPSVNSPAVNDRSYPPFLEYLSLIRSVGEYNSTYLLRVHTVVRFLYRQWTSTGERIAMTLSKLGRHVKIPGKLSVVAAAAHAMGVATLSGSGNSFALQLVALEVSPVSPSSAASTPSLVYSPILPIFQVSPAMGPAVVAVPSLDVYMSRLRPSSEYQPHHVRALVAFLHSHWTTTRRRREWVPAEIGTHLKFLHGKLRQICAAANAVGVITMSDRRNGNLIQLNQL